MKAPTSAAQAKSRVPAFTTKANGLTHPHLDASPQFVLIAHPRRFQVLSGRLIPALATQRLVAGVNGVSTFEKDGVEYVEFATVRARLEKEGRMMVPLEWAPDGESYLNVVDTKPGGGKEIAEAWISVFETAHLGATRTETDQDAYAAWVESLVVAGKLNACPLDVATSMLQRAKRKHASAQQMLAKGGGAGAHSFRVEAFAKEIGVLEAYIAKARGEAVKAAPKSGRRGLNEAPKAES
jgi:hypothetical protein